jgi:hypothetical protein
MLSLCECCPPRIYEGAVGVPRGPQHSQAFEPPLALRIEQAQDDCGCSKGGRMHVIVTVSPSVMDGQNFDVRITSA